jgi:equilibrative nucleoside transporter 1/2/3
MGERPPPADRYNMVYFIVMLHGVGVLLPWNSFLTLGKEVQIA